jgi:hypothetical protein
MLNQLADPLLRMALWDTEIGLLGMHMGLWFALWRGQILYVGPIHNISWRSTLKKHKTRNGTYNPHNSTSLFLKATIFHHQNPTLPTKITHYILVMQCMWIMNVIKGYAMLYIYIKGYAPLKIAFSTKKKERIYLNILPLKRKFHFSPLPFS